MKSRFSMATTPSMNGAGISRMINHRPAHKPLLNETTADYLTFAHAPTYLLRSAMTTRFPFLRPKYFLFGLIAVMMLIVIRKDLALIHPTPEMTHHYSTFKWWLIPHGIAGALALFLGPLQFSKRLRQRFLPWHRIVGRVYVYGVAIAAPLGAYLEYVKNVNGIGSTRLVVASSGFAALWLITTGTGFQMARLRKIDEHRKWMT